MFVLIYLRIMASLGLYVFSLDAETVLSSKLNFPGDKRNNRIKMFSCGIVSNSLHAWNNVVMKGPHKIINPYFTSVVFIKGRPVGSTWERGMRAY